MKSKDREYLVSKDTPGHNDIFNVMFLNIVPNIV